MSLLRLLLSEPMVEPFVECPKCHRMLRPGLEGCPECGQIITEEYARSNVVAVVLRTQACAMAGEIEGAMPGLMILIVIDVASAFFACVKGVSISFILFSLYTVLASGVMLLAVLVWFHRYGRVDDGDEEYLRAKRRMKGKHKLLLALLALQFIAFGFWLF